jgi:hypothetical protein
MRCECCNAEIPEGSAICLKCRSVVPYNIKGFQNTKKVQALMRSLVSEHCDNIKDLQQFIGITVDMLPDYDPERILLVKAFRAGLLDVFLTGSDRKAEIASAGKLLKDQCGLSDEETEFVLSVVTYMFKMRYVSKNIIRVKGRSDDKEKSKPAPVTVDSKVYKKLDAMLHILSKFITVKEGYTKIDSYCFEGFGMLKSVNLPQSLMAIGEYAFTDCKKLTDIVIPPSVKKIDKGAFNACVSLKNVRLPDGLIEIGDNTFLCCSELETLVIPESVSGFGENAFSGCDSLKKLVVPQNVKFIDKNAFAYCPNLVVYCYENSYVHKYCMHKKIKFKTQAAGTVLPGYDTKEE